MGEGEGLVVGARLRMVVSAVAVDEVSVDMEVGSARIGQGDRENGEQDGGQANGSGPNQTMNASPDAAAVGVNGESVG